MQTSGVLKDVAARILTGAVTSGNSGERDENTNLFTIRVQRDASPETAYRVMKSVITNYPEVAEHIIGAESTDGGG